MPHTNAYSADGDLPWRDLWVPQGDAPFKVSEIELIRVAMVRDIKRGSERDHYEAQTQPADMGSYHYVSRCHARTQEIQLGFTFPFEGRHRNM